MSLRCGIVWFPGTLCTVIWRRTFIVRLFQFCCHYPVSKGTSFPDCLRDCVAHWSKSFSWIQRWTSTASTYANLRSKDASFITKSPRFFGESASINDSCPLFLTTAFVSSISLSLSLSLSSLSFSHSLFPCRGTVSAVLLHESISFRSSFPSAVYQVKVLFTVAVAMG